MHNQWGGGGGGCIFIYSCSARRIFFEMNLISKEIRRAEHEYLSFIDPERGVLYKHFYKQFYKPSFKRSCGSFRCISGIFFVQNSFNFFINYSSLASAIFVIFNFVDFDTRVLPWYTKYIPRHTQYAWF